MSRRGKAAAWLDFDCRRVVGGLGTVTVFAWLIVLVVVAALAHLLFVGRFAGFFTLDGIFVLAQWVMATGTLVLLDSHNNADRLYAYVVTVPFAIYVATSITFYHRRRRKLTEARIGLQRLVTYYRPSRLIWALVIVSVGITIAYYEAVGYNNLVLGIEGLLTGTTFDYTTRRLESYSGGNYLFPGYVNQFKNTLLPSLTLVASLYLVRTRNRWRYVVATPLALVSIYGILGTGQRGAFILFSVTILVFFYFLDRRMFLRRAAITAALVAPFVLFATYLLGRSSASLAEDAGPFTKMWALAVEIVRRIFHDNQYSGQQAFRYTYSRPIQYGGEWFQSALGVLPNHSGSPLSHEVFKHLYGSDRGTSPPSMWGSVYYNFGWWGLLAIPVALAIGFQTVSIRAMAKSQVNTLELVGMSGTFVVAGTWIADGPMYLLNAGAVTFAIIWWMGRRAGGRPKEGSIGTWVGEGSLDRPRVVGRGGQPLARSSVPGDLAGKAGLQTCVLVVSRDAYRYSARGMKAAGQYSEIAPTDFLGLSEVGRAGPSEAPGEFVIDGLRVRHVRVRGRWLSPVGPGQVRKRPFGYGLAFLRLARAVLTTPASAIHIVGTPLALLGVAHRRKYRSHFVLDIDERPGSVARRGSLVSASLTIKRTLLTKIAKRVDIATVASEEDVKVVASMGFNRVQAVRNMPLSTWRAPYFPPTSDSARTLTLAVAGPIVEGGGYEALLESLVKVEGERAVRLRVYGGVDSNYVSSLKRLTATWGLQERVEWMGCIEPEDVSAAYLDAHVGLALREEVDREADGLSSHILECVATGRPVIAIDSSENRRFVTENAIGWIADVSAEGLAKAIGHVPDGADLEELSSKCRLLGDTLLNWEREFAPVIDALNLARHDPSCTGRV